MPLPNLEFWSRLRPFWLTTRKRRSRWLWDYWSHLKNTGEMPKLHFGTIHILSEALEEDAVETPVPVGWPCFDCKEKFKKDDGGLIITIWQHGLPDGEPGDEAIPFPAPIHERCIRKGTEGGMDIKFVDDETALSDIFGGPTSELVTRMNPSRECHRCGHFIEDGELAGLENLRLWNGQMTGDSICADCMKKEAEELGLVDVDS